MNGFKFGSFITIITFTVFSCSEKRYPEALSLQESISSFEIHEDFIIELFAAEPHVWDPVDMIFDENGNVYVVEMPDYPYKPEPGAGKGRIRHLRDTNGDGLIDESAVFAEGLADATSIMAWKGGLIVTTAPYILYLKDTTGDFIADQKEVLFEGFFDNNSEAQITSLRLGVDNWIYAANHGQPGEVTSALDPDAPALDMRGADFRFRMDTGEFELETGSAQFGHTMDDWGNRYITQNTLHVQQAVIPRRYLRRHSHLPAMSATSNISDHELEMFQLTPPPYWRAERTKRRNIQYQEQNLDRIEYADKHFTGASGGTVYLGDAFPQSFYGNLFTGDVAGNLVHRDVLLPSGENPEFVASRAGEETNKEFLASTDPWFRPVNFTVGPDGYLYVVDFYRQHIETPVSIPDDLKDDMDFMYGENHGRIYRIRPKNEKGLKLVTPDLRSKTGEELVKLLAHPNHWWRQQAQRLLLEKKEPTTLTSLVSLFYGHEDPRARLHALYAIDGLGAMESKFVRQALKDSHEGVRKHGLILAERYPDLMDEVDLLIHDPSVQVALQACLSLGQFDHTSVAASMLEIMEKYGENHWFRMAVLSSGAGSNMEFVRKLFDNGFFAISSSWKVKFLEDFSYVLGSKKEEGLDRFITMLTDSNIESEWRLAGLNGLLKGLKKHEGQNEKLKEILANIQTGTDEEVTSTLRKLSNI